jgi:hypothetical protein
LSSQEYLLVDAAFTNNAWLVAAYKKFGGQIGFGTWSNFLQRPSFCCLVQSGTYHWYMEGKVSLPQAAKELDHW